MPPSKRQKTGRNSGVGTQDQSSRSPTRRKRNEGNSDEAKKPDLKPYEYMCMHRPFFDYESENRACGEDCRDDVFEEVYKPGFDAEKAQGIFRKPASEREDWKWVIMTDAWDKYSLQKRRSKYCNPDNFKMHIYTDWHGWGLQELVENMIAEFDKGYRKGGDAGMNEMWSTISALGLWQNADDMGMFINNENGEKTCELCGLVGYALLTALDAIKRAGELKPDSKYKDLALVIGYFLEWSHDLPAYGIEGNAVSWRPEAVTYFKDAGLEPQKGTFMTPGLVEQLDGAPNYDSLTMDIFREKDGPVDDMYEEKDAPKGTEKDPWAWKARIAKYKKRRGKLGGHHYDITKFSRAERAELAFDGKDPLANVKVSDLKNDLVDFVPA